VSYRPCAPANIVHVDNGPAILDALDKTVGPIVGESLNPATARSTEDAARQVVGECVRSSTGGISPTQQEVQIAVGVSRDLSLLIGPADDITNSIIGIADGVVGRWVGISLAK